MSYRFSAQIKSPSETDASLSSSDIEDSHVTLPGLKPLDLYAVEIEATDITHPKLTQYGPMSAKEFYEALPRGQNANSLNPGANIATPLNPLAFSFIPTPPAPDTTGNARKPNTNGRQQSSRSDSKSNLDKTLKPSPKFSTLDDSNSPPSFLSKSSHDRRFMRRKQTTILGDDDNTFPLDDNENDLPLEDDGSATYGEPSSFMTRMSDGMYPSQARGGRQLLPRRSERIPTAKKTDKATDTPKKLRAAPKISMASGKKFNDDLIDPRLSEGLSITPCATFDKQTALSEQVKIDDQVNPDWLEGEDISYNPMQEITNNVEPAGNSRSFDFEKYANTRRGSSRDDKHGDQNVHEFKDGGHFDTTRLRKTPNLPLSLSDGPLIGKSSYPYAPDKSATQESSEEEAAAADVRESVETAAPLGMACSAMIVSPVTIAQPFVGHATCPSPQLTVYQPHKLLVNSPSPPFAIIAPSVLIWDYAQTAPEILPQGFTRPPNKSNPTGPPALTGARNLVSKPFRRPSKEPPVCESCPSGGQAWPLTFPEDLLGLVTAYLSHDEVRTLRLVSKSISKVVTPILFRNVVTEFSKATFDLNLGDWDCKTGTPPRNYFTEKFGRYINKFGISFEVDLMGLFHARPKARYDIINTWFGPYPWPIFDYPRFAELKSLEDLCDDNQHRLLKDMFQHLTDTSELAISIDSGHGWLNGPDLSDMQVFEERCNGERIFGKNFPAEDKWQEHVRDELFQWAQMNSINEGLKALVAARRQTRSGSARRTKDIQFLRSVAIRDRKSFEVQANQHDHDPRKAHTGGTVKRNFIPNFVTAAQMAQNAFPNMPHHFIGPPYPGQLRNTRPTPKARGPKGNKPNPTPVMPQYPLIFNGHNLSAQVGGAASYIQDKVFDPAKFPLRPGSLSEAQAQWLMETAWAQRLFLGAFTYSIHMNQASLRKVHSLHIAKLSSGLLPSLDSDEFWRGLPNLKTLTMLISPDWRNQHIDQDRNFQTNMLISPVHASEEFASFLEARVLTLEKLSSLTIGFVGGGEHATGMSARNQHVLPAPVTTNPREWILNHRYTLDPSTMLRFDHIKDLRIQNCYFSPAMLKGFMEKAHDTSLRHLILDSVSLTAAHTLSSTVYNPDNGSLEPRHGVNAWLLENLHTSACWSAVLDSVTPGVTFLEQKHAQGLINSTVQPMPAKSFRGNVEKITLKSCGYVRISGVAHDIFNQNEVVCLNGYTVDDGLKERKIALSGGQIRERIVRRRGSPVGMFTGGPPTASSTHVNSSRPGSAGAGVSASDKLMMSTIDPSTGREYFGLGTLTQCIHAIDKRVLEQAWGMTFGWGNDMKRWAAVEDGFFEGGTGRLSGVVNKHPVGVI